MKKEILPMIGTFLIGMSSPTTNLTNTTTKTNVTTKNVARGDCYQFTIEGGKYAGTKCYTQTDAAQLEGLIGQYNEAVTRANSLIGPAQSACAGEDQQACHDAAMAFNAASAEAMAIEKKVAVIVRRSW